jgi:hypothetical protein
MTEEAKEDLPPPSDEELEAQERAMKKLLEADQPAPPRSLLADVQRKIRARSKGKFYADGWSVEAGRINYMLVAVIMLIVLAVAYVALAPTSISR